MHVDAACVLEKRSCGIGVVLRSQLKLELQRGSSTFTSSLCAKVVAVQRVLR